MDREGGTYLEVVGQWRVAAAGTDDDVFYAVGSEERSKYVDVFVIRICFHCCVRLYSISRAMVWIFASVSCHSLSSSLSASSPPPA